MINNLIECPIILVLAKRRNIPIEGHKYLCLACPLPEDKCWKELHTPDKKTLISEALIEHIAEVTEMNLLLVED